MKRGISKKKISINLYHKFLISIDNNDINSNNKNILNQLNNKNLSSQDKIKNDEEDVKRVIELITNNDLNPSIFFVLVKKNVNYWQKF